MKTIVDYVFSSLILLWLLFAVAFIFCAINVNRK